MLSRGSLRRKPESTRCMTQRTQMSHEDQSHTCSFTHVSMMGLRMWCVYCRQALSSARVASEGEAASGRAAIPTWCREKGGRCGPRNLLFSASSSAAKDVDKADCSRNVQGRIVDTHGQRATDTTEPFLPASKRTCLWKKEPGSDK